MVKTFFAQQLGENDDAALDAKIKGMKEADQVALIRQLISVINTLNDRVTALENKTSVTI